MKIINIGDSLKIGTNIEGTPVYIVRESKRERIIRIYYSAQDSNVNGNQLHRSYVTVKTSKGHTYDIYREGISKTWCVSRVYG